MFKSVCIKVFLFLSVCILWACNNSSDKLKLDSQFKPDYSGIVFLNIEKSSLILIKKMLEEPSQVNVANPAYSRLVSVIQLNEEDTAGLAEEVFAGKLVIQDNQLLFIPDKPFVKGKEYLVETFIESTFGSFKDVLRGDLGSAPEPKTFTLKR